MKEELNEAYKEVLSQLYKTDPYVYKNGTLKNKLGITDYQTLRQAEADISFVKLFTIDQDLTYKEFDIDYLRRIHKYILEDVFDWAGDFRTVTLFKAEKILGNDTVRYAHPNEILSRLDKTIKNLHRIKWDGMEIDQIVPVFTKEIADMWQIHPFRDGNTRTIVAYALQFSEEKGFKIQPDLLLNHFEYVRGALVWASQGEYSKYGYINKIVKDGILRQMKIDGKDYNKQINEDIR